MYHRLEAYATVECAYVSQAGSLCHSGVQRVYHRLEAYATGWKPMPRVGSLGHGPRQGEIRRDNRTPVCLHFRASNA